MRPTASRVSDEMPRRRLLLPALCGIALATVWGRWGCLSRLDDETLAARLLESRGILCTPKIVQRMDEGELYVVCANGKYDMVAQPSCSESYACELLHFDAACWDIERR